MKNDVLFFFLIFCLKYDLTYSKNIIKNRLNFNF